MVPYAVEEPGTNLVPQEVHPPQEALFTDRRIFVHVLQYHWHDYHQGAMDVDQDARDHIMELARRLHEFGQRTEAREMQLWGQMQEVMRASEVHQLVIRLESSMQEGTTQFAQRVYEHVEKEVARLDEGLNALGGDMQDFNRNQIIEAHLRNFATSSQIQAVDARVTGMEFAYRTYVDQTMTAARTRLLAEISGRVVMGKAGFQQ